MCLALSLYLSGLKGEVSVPRLQSHTAVSCALLSASPSCPHKRTPQPILPSGQTLQNHSPPLPCLLPLLLKLSKPCNLLVLLLFSHSHLPLVLGYELNPGLLSFPAVGCVLS